jgi:Ulp1 family protease
MVQVKLENGPQSEYPWYSKRVNAPKQENGYDCGIFILEYAAQFLNDPKSLICNPDSSILALD